MMLKTIQKGIMADLDKKYPKKPTKGNRAKVLATKYFPTLLEERDLAVEVDKIVAQKTVLERTKKNLARNVEQPLLGHE